MHQLVQLAKKAIEEYVNNKETISPPPELTEEMREKSGVFVSLKKHGQLRGCIGTFLPSTNNVAKETIRNAISAATEDPRFHKVKQGELEEMTYSVDVLSPPVGVNDISELDPQKYGVIVVKGFRKGLLLPNLEGVDTVKEQLRITKLKAGIDPDDHEIEIYKFDVRRFF